MNIEPCLRLFMYVWVIFIVMFIAFQVICYDFTTPFREIVSVWYKNSNNNIMTMHWIHLNFIELAHLANVRCIWNNHMRQNVKSLKSRAPVSYTTMPSFRWQVMVVSSSIICNSQYTTRCSLNALYIITARIVAISQFANRIRCC